MRIVFIFTILLLFNCKQSNSQVTKARVNNISEKKEIEEIRNNWIFYKSISLSPESNYSCDVAKYKSFEVDISNDSVFIKNKYTDNVYNTTTSSENFFKHKYLYEAVKKILRNEFKLNLPKNIKCIRNKRVYDKASELDKYFQDAFFVDKYIFIEKEGCIFCYRKKNNTILPTPKKLSESISKNDFLNLNVKLPIINKKVVINDSEASTVYELANDIFLLWFDGDNERWYISTFVNDKLYDKLLIGKSETVEFENGKVIDNYIDFNIDKDLKIKLEYSSGQNYTDRKIKKIENYKINPKTKKIEAH